MTFLPVTIKFGHLSFEKLKIIIVAVVFDGIDPNFAIFTVFVLI